MSVSSQEDEIIESVVSQEDAEQIDEWSRVDPDYQDDTILQWTDASESIVVFVKKEEIDDETKYSARAEPLDDDIPFGNKIIERWAESLETAIDEAIRWMRRHQPDVDVPTFTMRIEGGVFKPLMNVVRRFGGQNLLIEVRSTGVHFESASHVNEVEFDISAADMQEYEVEREGEFVVGADFPWDALKPVNFSDTVPIALDASDDRPKLQIANQSTFVKISAEYFRRSAPEPFPFTAQFTIPGLEFRDVTQASRVTDADDAIFGALDGVVFIQTVSADKQVEFTGRFEVDQIEGEQVVLVAHDRLQNLRKSIPRLSQTGLQFTLKDNDPMLVEFHVDGTDVDVLIALKTGPIPREFDFPPEEIEVPEEPAEEEVVETAARELFEDVAEVGDRSVVTVDGQGPDKSIDLMPGPPDAVLRNYPTGREDVDPFQLFLEDLIDTISETVNVERFVHGDVLGFVEYQSGGLWEFVPEDPDLIEVPIIVVTTTAGPAYGVPEGEASMAVDDEVNDRVRDLIGGAGQFLDDKEVGTAFLTNVDIATQRRLVDVEIDEEVEEEAEMPLRVGTAVSEDWSERNLMSLKTEYITQVTQDEILADSIGFNSMEEVIAATATPFPDINDDLMKGWLMRQGVSADSATAVGKHFRSPFDLMRAVRRGDDLTELEGVGQVRGEEVDDAMREVDLEIPEMRQLGILDPDIEVGHFARVEYRDPRENDGNPEVWGDVVYVENGLFVVKVGDSRTVVNTDEGWVITGPEHQQFDLEDVTEWPSMRAEFDEGSYTESGDEIHPPRQVEEDDLERVLTAFGVPPIAAQHLSDGRQSVAEVMRAIRDIDDPTDLSGITEKNVDEVIDHLRIDVDFEVTEEEPETVDMDWPGAVDYLREHYDDSFEARIALGSDLSRFADEHEFERSSRLGDEGVLQPLIRYQDVAPEDAWTQIRSRAGDDAELVRDVVTAFAAADAARGAEETDEGDDVPPPDDEEPPEEESASIIVSIIGGTLNYNVPGQVPGAVADEAIGAARDVLGQPGQFDANDTVGQVTFRGSEIESISIEEGQRILAEAEGREPPGDGDGDEEDGEDLLDLPVMVQEAFDNGFIYVAPPNTVPLDVSEQIDSAMEGELGDAGQFGAGMEVGTAFVTPEENPMAREFVRVEPAASLVEDEPEAEPEPEPPTAAEEPGELSRAEMETIIEEATRGVTVDLQMMAEDFREFRLDVVGGEGIRFRQNPDRITVSTGDTPGDTIRKAIDRWAEFANIDELDPSDVAEINQARQALQEQFDVAIPQLVQPTVEGIDEEDIQRIVGLGTQGVAVEVDVNVEADSIRISMEPTEGGTAAFAATLDEVQGQATNPVGAIREALDEWEDSVDKATIEVDRINRRRGRLAREFDISLPEVEKPTQQRGRAEERSALLDEWNTIMEDLELVPIEEGRLVAEGDTPIPIEVDEEFAQFADDEDKRQIEQGLQVHHTEEVHEDVHAFIAQLLGAEPENFYDSSKPSDLPGYDLYYTFTLSRNQAPGEWTNPRFAPSTLFEILAPLDGNELKVLARGAPLA